VRVVDVVHQLVVYEALVVDVHAQVMPDVVAAWVGECLLGGAVRPFDAMNGMSSSF
jgi:hypothetical protein